jgi:hypothetical protein
MRGIFVFIGVCAVILAIASTKGMSGQFCLGSHSCVVVNGDGVHVVDQAAVSKLQTP